ncbi:MAG: hypothetical protein AAF413_01040 [Patescibacteria group bacterium]
MSKNRVQLPKYLLTLPILGLTLAIFALYISSGTYVIRDTDDSEQNSLNCESREFEQKQTTSFGALNALYGDRLGPEEVDNEISKIGPCPYDNDAVVKIVPISALLLSVLLIYSPKYLVHKKSKRT